MKKLTFRTINLKQIEIVKRKIAEGSTIRSAAGCANVSYYTAQRINKGAYDDPSIKFKRFVNIKKKKRLTLEMLTEALRLLRSGFTWLEVAKALDVSKTTVWKIDKGYYDEKTGKTRKIVLYVGNETIFV